MPIYPQPDKSASPDINLAALNSNAASKDNPFATKKDVQQGEVAIPRTGTTLKFDQESFYGDIIHPQTGNILVDYTGAALGITSILFHDDSSEPTYPASFIKLSGSKTYLPNQMNYYILMYVGNSQVLYKIEQNAT